MGELHAYYLSADVAFVGGSLVDSGCQNIIEPLSCHVPTIFGFSTYNFAQACSHALEAGTAIQVDSADGWREAVESVLAQGGSGTPMSERIEKFISQHRGASERMAEIICQTVRNADSVCE